MFDITERGGGGRDPPFLDNPPSRKFRANVSVPEMRFHANLSLRKLSRVFTLSPFSPDRQARFWI